MAIQSPSAKLAALFRDHPSSVGESYASHMAGAISFAARMWVGGLACFIHALLPFLFTRTGSDATRVLHIAMVTDRDRVRGGKLVNAGAPDDSPSRTDSAGDGS